MNCDNRKILGALPRALRAHLRPACVLLGLLSCLATVGRAEVRVGDEVPKLTELELDGELPELRGRVVLIDVWASWCAPCEASFPALARLHREFEPAGLAILAVSVDRKERDYQRFLSRQEPPFTTVRDTTQAFARRFAPPAMPTSYVIDRQGRVRAVEVGFHGERTLRPLRQLLRQLLAEQP